MINPYRGEAEIEIAGRTYVLWFGWPGIAMLKSQLGDNFDVELARAMAGQDLRVLAKVLAIGLRDSWPGVTPEQIERLSPPIARTIEAVSTALRRTYQGEEAAAEPQRNPPRLRRLRKAMSWLRRTKPRSRPA
ncbi:MAG: hypothetical protein IRZ09_14575 [Variibacter sp.]|jgi:hypothetical protein|nr:hypothetical protein [Variibacter sp.]